MWAVFEHDQSGGLSSRIDGALHEHPLLLSEEYMSFCQRCGTQVADEACFCQKCGAATNLTQPQPSPERGAGIVPRGNWEQASDVALKEAYENRNRFTKEEYVAIFSEFNRRGLKPQMSWGWIIFWLILFWPVGLYFIVRDRV